MYPTSSFQDRDICTVCMYGKTPKPRAAGQPHEGGVAGQSTATTDTTPPPSTECHFCSHPQPPWLPISAPHRVHRKELAAMRRQGRREGRGTRAQCPPKSGADARRPHAVRVFAGLPGRSSASRRSRSSKNPGTRRCTPGSTGCSGSASTARGSAATWLTARAAARARPLPPLAAVAAAPPPPLRAS